MSKISTVVTEKVLANLADFWASPSPCEITHRMPERIACGPYDQQVPEGTQNPYWEIIRQLPLTSIGYPWATRPEPDAHWFGPRHSVRQFGGGRHSLCMTFSWSVISPGDVDWIRERAAGRGIIEAGAGGGYWAWQLAQAGVDVVAYDPAEPAANGWTVGEPWYPVLRNDHRAVTAHPGRSLLLVWPTYSHEWASHALKLYQGDQVFYAGESEGGCCADDAFFHALGAEWEEAGDSARHITYHGIHCSLTEYRRKSSTEGSA